MKTQVLEQMRSQDDSANQSPLMKMIGSDCFSEAPVSENALLTPDPTFPIAPTATREIRTKRSAYSVRSWPFSSCHSLLRSSYISVFLLFMKL